MATKSFIHAFHEVARNAQIDAIVARTCSKRQLDNAVSGLRNGDAAGGRADMAEAAGISPDLPNRVTRLGLATEAETKG